MQRLLAGLIPASAGVLAQRGWALARTGVAQGAAKTLLLKTVEAGAAFLIAVVLARALGATEFGMYSLAMAWAGLLTVPALVGMENLSVRHTAAYSAQQRWSHLRGLLRRAFQIVTVISLSLTLVSGAAALALSGPQGVVLLVGLLMIPPAALMRIAQAALRGLGHIGEGFVPELAITPSVVLLLIGGSVVAGLALTALAAVTIHLVAGLLALAVAVVLLWRRIPEPVRAAQSIYLTREWLTAAMPLLFIGGMQTVIRQTDVIMVAALIGVREAGIYAVATRGAQLISFVLYAVNAPLAPRFARLYALGDVAAMQRLATAGARVVLLITLPAAAAFIFAGDLFVGIFGPEFLPAAPALAVLTVGQLVNAASGSVGSLLTMTGHERDAAFGFGLSAVLNIGLNLLLIPIWGPLGAAVATASSLVAWNVILSIAVYRRLRIDATALGLFRYTAR